MRNVNLYGCYGILALAAASFAACSSDDNGGGTSLADVNWTTDGGLKACDHLLFTADGDANVSDEGTQIGNGDNEFVFTGKQTLKKGTYLLKGWVYIARGAELTIEPGTVIKGDKQTKAALIAERGGKLIAQGTQAEPIVFTSEEAKGNRRPGDWGGVILCGEARNNQGEQQIEGGPRTKHGGNVEADNSGVLSYVRIEFAGYPFEKDKEINGLTFGSVGSGTKVDHVQVSYSNDDSFEWFGGDVDCRYMVAFRGWDDDFDTDNGFSGKVQYGLAVRDSRLADVSMSNGFESDNNADGTNADPHTSAVFSNITFIGPKAVDPDFQNTADYITGGSLNPNNGSSLGRFQAAMHIRRGSRLNCFNSVAVGWPIGLILDGEKGDTPASATDGLLKLQHLVFADMTILGADENKATEAGAFTTAFWQNQSTNQYFNSITGLFDMNATKYYMPTAGSSLLSGADFTDALLTGFDRVSFIGAFDNVNDWTQGWTNFDPENTDY